MQNCWKSNHILYYSAYTESMSAELLHSVEEGLQQLTIALDHPCNHRQYTQLLPKIPVTCLKIPNMFFVAADNIRCLTKVLKMRTPSLIEMVNKIVEEGGDKIRNDASQVEERLELKLRRLVHTTGIAIP